MNDDDSRDADSILHYGDSLLEAEVSAGTTITIHLRMGRDRLEELCIELARLGLDLTTRFESPCG